MKIYHATWIGEVSQGGSLTAVGAKYRLLSYHFIKDQKISNRDLRKYKETGECDLLDTRKSKYREPYFKLSKKGRF